MTEALSENTATLQRRIANWLTHTRNVDIAIDGDQEQTARKARELRQAILEGSLEPESLIVDEDLKEALSALVSLLAASDAAVSEKLGHANAVYQFIERLAWTEDPLTEKRDLLLECAEVGWGAKGLSVAETPGRRLARELDGLHDLGSDPVFISALTIAEELIESRDSNPKRVAEKAATLYSSIGEAGRRIGFFDEHHDLLGRLALLAGGANRLLGRRDDARLWLRRAEASFRNTISAEPALASVSYERLTIQHDMGQYQRVLDLMPSVMLSFRHMGMRQEELKCRLAIAMSFKGAGRFEEACSALEEMHGDQSLKEYPALHGLLLVNLAETRSGDGLFADALALCNEAQPLLKAANKPFMVAYMKTVIGECLRQQGSLTAAVNAYSEAIRDYGTLEMVTWVAYCRVILSDMLLALCRPQEAERELFAALPTIEEQKMVPEGFAAVALLKESVRRRKTDPNALRELREHLQASK